jgi:hypothetical protein
MRRVEEALKKQNCGGRSFDSFRLAQGGSVERLIDFFFQGFAFSWGRVLDMSLNAKSTSGNYLL